MSALLTPITSVTAVCRERAPRVLAIPHVVAAISDFADHSSSWAFLRACESGSVRLLRRVCGREALPGDPLVDPHYKAWRFNRGVKTAAARGDLQMVRWLAGEYMPGVLVTDGVQAAAGNGHFPVVEWLVEERGNVTSDADAVRMAACASAVDVMELIWQHLPTGAKRQSTLDYYSHRFLPLKCFEWAISQGYDCGERLLPLAAASGRLDVLQLVAGRFDKEYKRAMATRGDLSGDLLGKTKVKTWWWRAIR